MTWLVTHWIVMDIVAAAVGAWIGVWLAAKTTDAIGRYFKRVFGMDPRRWR